MIISCLCFSNWIRVDTDAVMIWSRTKGLLRRWTAVISCFVFLLKMVLSVWQEASKWIYISLTIVGFKAVGIVCMVWMFISAAVFTDHVTLALCSVSLFSPIFYSGFVSHLPLIHLLPPLPPSLLYRLTKWFHSVEKESSPPLARSVPHHVHSIGSPSSPFVQLVKMGSSVYYGTSERIVVS